MIEIKCETVGEKRKVSVQDGDSLVYAVEVPLSGKSSELKSDVAILVFIRTELRKRQVEVDAAITLKIIELEG